jgi:hypothetical protein
MMLYLLYMFVCVRCQQCHEHTAQKLSDLNAGLAYDYTTTADYSETHCCWIPHAEETISLPAIHFLRAFFEA